MFVSPSLAGVCCWQSARSQIKAHILKAKWATDIPQPLHPIRRAELLNTHSYSHFSQPVLCGFQRAVQATPDLAAGREKPAKQASLSTLIVQMSGASSVT